jgi:hypothetical protein
MQIAGNHSRPIKSKKLWWWSQQSVPTSIPGIPAAAEDEELLP